MAFTKVKIADDQFKFFHGSLTCYINYVSRLILTTVHSSVGELKYFFLSHGVFWISGDPNTQRQTNFYILYLKGGRFYLFSDALRNGQRLLYCRSRLKLK